MWITDEADLPEELISACESGELVIFAGAGISKSAPSRLPLFGKLAKELAEGSRLVLDKRRESIDGFLGRLQGAGVAIHTRAKAIYGDSKSKPTRLHHAIMSLLVAQDSVRLVTTNFDRHLSTVAESLMGEGLEVFHAPALPCGRDFDGIVYLHGSVDREPGRLIITDRDFGRAYLTDAWATRFLRDLFVENRVLFVGYGHRDPIMKYLARGLTPGTSRYALATPSEVEHWRTIGVVPVVYHVPRGCSRNRTLERIFSAWSDHVSSGVLDHERRIRQIVQSNPPLGRTEASYIEGALTKLHTLRFYTRYAQTAEWLRWADSQGVFDGLFGEIENEASASDTEIAAWFAKTYVCEFPDESLALVMRHGQQLGPVLWRHVAYVLAHHDPLPDPDVLGRWICVLLRSPRPDWRLNELSFVLQRCRYPEDGPTAVLLLDYLIRPKVELKREFRLRVDRGSVGERIGLEASIAGDEHPLSDAWETLFKPNLETFAEAVEPILSTNLTNAHLLLQASASDNHIQDGLSLSRSAIEPHSDDRHRDGLDVLIDMCRDVIEWMVEQSPDRGREVIEAWSRSEVTLLRRLAIHGVAESSRVTPDEKIRWVLEKDWLFTWGLKHEVFRLLSVAYPQADEGARRRVLERADQGPLGADRQGLDERSQDYRIYNVLVWLSRNASECSMAEERKEAMEVAHPDFAPREHPDLDMWTRVEAGATSPLTAGQILEMDPSTDLAWLLSYRGEGLRGPDRKGLLAAIAEAVANDATWAWRLVRALQEQDEWISDLWRSIVGGWEKGGLNEAEWRRVLAFLVDRRDLNWLADQIAHLLLSGLKTGEGTLPVQDLCLVEQLTEQLYNSLDDEVEATSETGSREWLTDAINHPGGKIMEVWLGALSRKLRHSGDGGDGIPAPYDRLIDQVLLGGSHKSRLARVVLASQLHFLFAIAADWTRANVLPLFDWSIDEDRAEQAWHGYLGWGRLGLGFLGDLLPLYRQSFGHLSGRLSGKRGLFCRHVAAIAVYHSSETAENGWIGTFLQESDPESREYFAADIGDELQHLSEDQIAALWERWLGGYISQRIDGIPVPLSGEETKKMVLWGVSLKPVFSAFVNLMCTFTAPSLPHTVLYSELERREFPAAHPAPVTHLLLHLLSSATDPFLQCSEVGELVTSLVASQAPRNELIQICDELARLGCPDAIRLREIVDAAGSGD